jgi:hypothetical protein
MIRIQFENDKLFDFIRKSKAFEIMDNYKVNNIKVTEKTIVQNKYLNELKLSVYEQLKQMKCDDILFPTEENFVMEFWNTEFKKNKKTQRTSLGWHTDDYEVIPYKTYTAIVYYYRGDGITGGNLTIEDANDTITIDTWSNKTFLIFKGEMTHCPQEVTVIDNTKKLKRQIVTMFFARK